MNCLHSNFCTNQAFDVDRMVRVWSQTSKKNEDLLNIALRHAVTRGHALCTKHLMSIGARYKLRELLHLAATNARADVFCFLLTRQCSQQDVDLTLKSVFRLHLPTAAPDELYQILHHTVMQGFTLNTLTTMFYTSYQEDEDMSRLLLCPNVLRLILLHSDPQQQRIPLINYFITYATEVYVNITLFNSDSLIPKWPVFKPHDDWISCLLAHPYSFYHIQYLQETCKAVLNLFHKLGYLLLWDNKFVQLTHDMELLLMEMKPNYKELLNIPEFQLELKEHMQLFLLNPLSLKDQCRIALIRKKGTSYWQSIQSLSKKLPKQIVEYLLGADLNYEHYESTRLNAAALMYNDLKIPFQDRSDSWWHTSEENNLVSLFLKLYNGRIRDKASVLTKQLSQYLERWQVEKPSQEALKKFDDIVHQLFHHQQDYILAG